MPKVTINELAARAGLSRATVDRVLHGRMGASAKSIEKVAKAAEEIGYLHLPGHVVEAARKSVKMVLMLPELRTGFVEALAHAAHTETTGHREIGFEMEVQRLNLIGGSDTIEALSSKRLKSVDVICLFAVDSPGVREAIDALVRAGKVVVTIVSDVPSSMRHDYVGLDNVAAGRVAGRLIGRFACGREGKIGIITGSNLIRDHLERTMGFNQILSEQFPGLSASAIKEGYSLADKNFAAVQELIASEPDLVGLYSIAGGNAGVYDALRRFDPDRKLIVLGHELTKTSRKALLDETFAAVINQNTATLMRNAFDTIERALTGRSALGGLLVPEIYIPENLP